MYDSKFGNKTTKIIKCWKSDKNGPAVKEVSILSCKGKILKETMVN